MKRIFVPLLVALTMTAALPARAQSDGKKVPITATNASQVTQVAMFQQDYVSGVAFSPDGSLIAIATASTVQLWDVKTGQSKAILKGPGLSPNGVAFSPDGSLVAAASGNWINPTTDPTVWLWDVKTGQAKTILQTIPNEKGSADGVAFSPDGKLLASAQHGDRVSGISRLARSKPI